MYVKEHLNGMETSLPKYIWFNSLSIYKTRSSIVFSSQAI